MKRILLLSWIDSPLQSILMEKGHKVYCMESKIGPDFLKTKAFDFLISYGYCFILSEEFLSYFGPKNVINMHISYLPYNRGNDPNFWSLYDGTPSGVTIHYLDKGIDTGDIIVQRRVDFDPERDTLNSSYKKLSQAIVALFVEHMDAILSGGISSKKQPHRGTYHNTRDKEELFNYLRQDYPNVWDTPISRVVKLKEALLTTTFRQ